MTEQALIQDITITTTDGFSLAATCFEVTGSDVWVLINSATAVPRQFYRRFASYIQDQGWSVLTFDYRGIGESRPKSLRGFEAKMRDWALYDIAGVIDWIVLAHQPRKLFVVGHSVGGQTLGLLENGHHIDAVVAVSAQSGYWGVQAQNERQRTRLIVSVAMPILSQLLGYFPWSKLGAGEDLPKGVALEWAGWCRQRNYLLDDPTLPLGRYERFVAPILSYSIDDDGWGTRQAVDEMMRAYHHVERRHIRPADYGLESIKHTGFFRPQSQALWDEALTWFKQL
ncbi:MAG: alpha/beta fold hydrolase [Chloroflexota bacterium]